MGKIGLALSPQNPDVLYAAIELNNRSGAVFRSTDRGESWEQRSDTVAGGTGPHYYQELYASPHAEGRIYLADVRMRVSDDGGKTFRIMDEEFKHSDNHSLTFRPDDPDYLLVGTDGGLYESFDLAKRWRFVDNLPITSSTRWPWTTPRRSTTSLVARRTTTPRAGPRAPTARTGFATRTGTSCSAGTGISLPPSPATPRSCTPSREEDLFRVDTTTGERVYIQPQAAPGDAGRSTGTLPSGEPARPDAAVLRVAAGVAFG